MNTQDKPIKANELRQQLLEDGGITALNEWPQEGNPILLAVLTAMLMQGSGVANAGDMVAATAIELQLLLSTESGKKQVERFAEEATQVTTAGAVLSFATYLQAIFEKRGIIPEPKKIELVSALSRIQ